MIGPFIMCLLLYFFFNFSYFFVVVVGMCSCDKKSKQTHIKHLQKIWCIKPKEMRKGNRNRKKNEYENKVH